MALSAALLVDKLKEIMDEFDQEAGDLKSQMKKLKPELDEEINKAIPKLPATGILVRRLKVIFPNYFSKK